ncbi:MAG: ABC transporter ATP-binding protein [Rhodothermales bacterium]|nr:ABC transporter ATP-binding protein [Rhodothermales bacterium]
MADPPADSTSQAGVRLENVTHSYGQLVAVDDLSLDVPAGAFVSLLGPSGCGKSTTLRIVAGFESPDSGRVLIGGRDVTAIEARRRPTAMVFQNYALFPHMSVGENVAYGLKVRRMSRSDIGARVRDVLARVDLGGHIDTPVTDLSGGQQQRAALARAIAVEPDVLLFDEPLSNLDVALRNQTRRELKELQRRIGVTSLYVTHDQEEALSLSDHVAVMRSGRIVQAGPPRKLYDEPSTAFVASFLGGANVLSGDGARAVTGRAVEAGKAIAVRAEHVRLSDSGQFEGRIRSTQFLGHVTECVLEFAGQDLRILTTGHVPGPGQARFDIAQWRMVEDDGTA